MSAHAISSSNCCTSETDLVLVAISWSCGEVTPVLKLEVGSCKDFKTVSINFQIDELSNQIWLHPFELRGARVGDKPHLPRTLWWPKYRNPQASSLPLGAHISCMIIHKDVLRGHIIVTDETNEAVVISILTIILVYSILTSLVSLLSIKLKG